MSTDAVGSVTPHPHPTVSIIIPCYNYGRFLAEAVESALAQTWPPSEVVIVDDGSTDESGAIAARYAARAGVRLICQARLGAVAAYNTGVRASRGEYFLILSADDRLDARYLERTIPVLHAHRHAGYVYTAYRMFGARRRLRPAPPYDAALLARRPYITATALMRRAAFDRCGGFSAAMSGGHEDWEFFVTLARHGLQGVAVPEVLFHYRKHGHASRNALAVRAWLGVRGRVFRRHRPLYRGPLHAHLARAVLEQQWLRARAAPRAILRRLTHADTRTLPDSGTARRACLLDAPALPGLDAHAGIEIVRLTRRRGGVGSLARLAGAALAQRAALYHAGTPGALVAAALAAIRHRAVLVYDAPPIGGSLVERLFLWRVDALTTSAYPAAVQRRLGLPAVVIERRRHGQAADENGRARERIERSRLTQLYADLLLSP